MAAQASLAHASLDKQDFPSAIQQFTSALKSHPTSPDYLIGRSTAYQRAQPALYHLALADAEAAVHSAHQRGKRELLLKAQLRRGIALYGLGRYKDAQRCLGWIRVKAGMEGDSDDKQLSGTKVIGMMHGAGKEGETTKGLGIWERKVEMKLKESTEAAETSEANDVLVEIPKEGSWEGLSSAGVDVGAVGTGEKAKSVDKMETTAESDFKSSSEQRADDTVRGSAAQTSAEVQPAGVPVLRPGEKLKHDWYQSKDSVSITLFVKGASKDRTKVEILERSISITLPLQDDTIYTFSLPQLFDVIDPATSSFSIKPSKIELLLDKRHPSRKTMKWANLGCIPGHSLDSASTSFPDAPLTASQHPRTMSNEPVSPSVSSPIPPVTGPSYPTSSRTGPKNWDKLAATLMTKPSPTEPGKLVDDEDAESDPVDGFFKKLYQGADADTRRAMMKSFQESNGTALNTNWSEVGKGRVETSPPEGMVAKSWNK